MRKIISVSVLFTLLSCAREEQLPCNCEKVYYQSYVESYFEGANLKIRTVYKPTGARERATSCEPITTWQKINDNSYYKVECK